MQTTYSNKQKRKNSYVQEPNRKLLEEKRNSRRITIRQKIFVLFFSRFKNLILKEGIMRPSSQLCKIHSLLFVSLLLGFVGMLSNVSAKGININISKKLTDLDNLMQDGKSYLAYTEYVNLLKQSPEQNIINHIAISTGELYYTLRLTDHRYHISSHIFSKDNKKLYYIKSNINDKTSLICEMDLENFNEKVLARKKYLEGGLIRLSDDNHISLIFYDYYSHDWYIIPSLPTNKKAPYTEDQFDKMRQPHNILNQMRRDIDTWNIYRDNPNVVIYSSYRQKRLRINENGNDSFLLAANQSVLQTAMLQSRRNGYCYLPSFSPDGSRITFLVSLKDLAPVSCYGKLMMSDFDGRNVRLLLKRNGITTPSFSPDGGKLVFGLIKKHDRNYVWWHNPKMSVIGMVDTDGKNFKEITYDILNNKSPIVSHDNSIVAYISTYGGHTARHLNLMFLDRYYTDEELLSRLNNIDTKQRAIFDVLKDIREAQKRYKNKYRKYAKNLAELINVGLLTGDIKDTYWDFNIKFESGLFTYKITATPVSNEKAGYVTFFFKDSGNKLNASLGKQTYSIPWTASIRTLPDRLEHY